MIMKSHILFLAATAALLLAGCGQGGNSNSGAAAAGPRTVELTANDQMKYDVTRIEAKAGETLTVVLTNNGTVPKEVMGHDWVLLKAGADVAGFAAAAAAAKDTDYIPAARAGDIIAKIGLLGPRKSDEVTFTVPSKPGEYTYLCTFPAHFQAGMHGVLVVQ
jgi:azurin